MYWPISFECIMGRRDCNLYGLNYNNYYEINYMAFEFKPQSMCGVLQEQYSHSLIELHGEGIEIETL